MLAVEALLVAVIPTIPSRDALTLATAMPLIHREVVLLVVAALSVIVSQLIPDLFQLVLDVSCVSNL